MQRELSFVSSDASAQNVYPDAVPPFATAAPRRRPLEPADDQDETLQRRFTDKDFESLVRKSLKLYEFTKYIAPSPTQQELDVPAPIQDFSARQAPVLRVEAGALEEPPIDSGLTVELNPAMVKAGRNSIFPARSLLARIGFSVPMPLNDCRKELQVVLNKSSDLCCLSSFTKESAIVDLVDWESGTCVGPSEVRVQMEETDASDESSPWNSPHVPVVVIFESLVESPLDFKLSLLNLYAKVRRNFEAAAERQASGNRMLVVPPKLPEPVFDVLTYAEQAPSQVTLSSIPSSCLSLLSSDDLLSAPPGIAQTRTIMATFMTTRKPDKALKLLERTILEAGYRVRRRPGFGLDIELLGKLTTPKTVVISASKVKTFGSHTSVALEGRIRPDSPEHTEFNVLKRVITSEFNVRPGVKPKRSLSVQSVPSSHSR